MFKGIPAWFWQMLEGADKKVSALADALESATRTKVEDFHGYHLKAGLIACAPENGPFINAEIDHLSEDSTKDLTEWIVSMGQAYWESVVNKSVSLQQAFWDMKHCEAMEPGAMKIWDASVQNPAYRGYQTSGVIAMTVFKHRFGESILDHEAAILARVGY